MIVGTVLNLINQGHTLAAPDFFDALAYDKLVLTYCVPYLVSTYSSVVALCSTRSVNNPTASS